MDYNNIDQQINDILNGTTDDKPRAIKSSLFNGRGAKEEDERQETFLNLINQSMQESARLVRSSLGRSSYAISREKALEQVAMLKKAEAEYKASKNT